MKKFIVIATGIVLILFLEKCIEDKTPIGKLAFNDFSGSSTCKQCHKNIYDSFLLTNHYTTSSYAHSSTVKGNFDSPENRFFFFPGTYVNMVLYGDSLFQELYKNNIFIKKVPFDFAIGSGKRGQTYLYWNKNRIIQLPISYFTATGEWVNSPGYSTNVVFNRPATSRCLECHSTYFNKTSDSSVYPEEFSKKEIILGVDCERCHGPAKKHVEYHTKTPGDTIAKYIVLTTKQSRQESLELCRFCHGGKLNKVEPSFSYAIGQPLSKFFSYVDTQIHINETDVHGNQYGMLRESKCFKNSAMTCNTCHNNHQNESGKLENFSKKCRSCHIENTGSFCKLPSVKDNNERIKNCIDCHMPEEPSKAIMVLRQGASIPISAKMRSHYIAIYKNL